MRLPALAFAALLAAPAVAAPPRVVATIPPTGSRTVDPALREIVVTFDAPMSRNSWSWCGGGETYPKIPDGQKPFFRDDRTAVLPVVLQPEHHYTLGINCPAAGGFRSASGETAQVHWLDFTTGAGSAATQSDPRNAAAWTALAQVIDRHYSHAARTGTDWQAAFAAGREWVLAAPSAAEWARRAAEVLAPARDPHLAFRLEDGTTIPTHRRNARVNADFAVVEHGLQDARTAAPGVSAGHAGSVAYLRIDTWPGDESRSRALDDALDAAMAAPALVVDVRANGGGDELAARHFAGRFVDAPAVYSRNRTRDPKQPGGWTQTFDRVVEPRTDRARFPGRVIVLQGAACLSSNESFILMMKASPRVVTLGDTTGGSSANPKPHVLPNGTTVLVPSWEDMQPDGTPIEGRGIAPDIAVQWVEGHGDPVMSRAMQEAARKP